jgi:hypothetical protein
MNRRTFQSVLVCLGLTGLLDIAALGQAPPVEVASKPALTNTPTLLLVVGAPGEKEFEDQFKEWADLWTEAARQGQANLISIGLDAETDVSDYDRLKKILTQQPPQSPDPLWIVLIGHGTFNNQVGKFNLRGPDVSAQELADWIQPFTRPLAILNTASASGSFLKVLSHPNRVILTATRSGREQNFTRLGQYLAQAIADPQADLDKDNQTSLLEAYLHAARQVAEFYTSEGRLATEHALIDDNGDGLGTPADWYRGVRVVKKAKDGQSHDGLHAHQLHLVQSESEKAMSPELKSRRNQLELQIAQLRDKKPDLKEIEYYSRLEALLVDMADIYSQTDTPITADENR